MLVSAVSDQSIRSHTTLNTWEDISNTSITFVCEYARTLYVFQTYILWRPTDGNWTHNLIRMLLDGSTSGVTPGEAYAAARNATSGTNDLQRSSAPTFSFQTTRGQHTVKLQTFDSNSNADREFAYTYVALEAVLM